MHGQIESPNTSSQAVELNPSCSRQAHPNRSGTGTGTGPGYKNMETETILTILRVPFMVYPLKRGCQVRQVCPNDSAQLA